MALPYCAGNRHIEHRPIPLEKKPELPHPADPPACTVPKAAESQTGESGETAQPQFQPSLSLPPDVYQAGIASWYGGKFNGRRTANGEIYDMYKLTAAHKQLPFNTLVEVENTRNRKKVLVRINDRGPFVKQRIIDLSYKAAQRIGMAETGTAPVALRIVSAQQSPPPNNQKTPGLTPPQNTYFIQAGAYRDHSNAQRILRRIQSADPGLEFSVSRDNGLYKIVSRRVKSRTEAQKAKRQLDRLGIDSFIKEKMIP
jgi:rare lipoprotein A